MSFLKQHTTQFILALLVTFGAMSILSGCSSSQALTEAEKQQQAEISTAVSNILFDLELDEYASFKIEKNGHVQIYFEQKADFFSTEQAKKRLLNNSKIPSIEVVSGDSCPF